MGGANSKEDQGGGGVQGLEENCKLSVIPIFRTSLRESYTVNRFTILKLKKSSMYSVESNILDSRGFYVFRKTGSFLTSSLEFRDDAGNIVASVEKKTSCSVSVAWVMLGSSPSPAVATLYHKYKGKKSCVGIYLHMPPLNWEDSEITQHQDREPDIRVEGNIGENHYWFLLATGQKIAQVHHQRDGRGPQVFLSPEHNMYTLEIGPNVDIAFIAFCVSAVDLLQLKSSLSVTDNLLYCLSACHRDTGEK